MKKVSNSYKLILFAIIAFALYKETFVNGKVVVGAFYYFTIQSNILVGISLLLFIFMERRSRTKCMIRGFLLLAITLTGIVYNFILYKIFIDWGTVGYTFFRTVTHVVAPIGFILDWILFDKHNMMKWKDILAWIIYPIVYCCVSLYAGFKYGFSIYFFLNTDNGYWNILKWIGLLLCALSAIGLMYVRLDKYLGRKKKRN